MEAHFILQPVAVLMVLTAAVWFWMHIKRLRFVYCNKGKLQIFSTSDGVKTAMPHSIYNASKNLKTLSELPIIFYIVCVCLFIQQSVTLTDIYCAWAFVILRIIHSFIQCMVNIVSARFMAYLLSSLILWVMVGHFLVDVFTDFR